MKHQIRDSIIVIFDVLGISALYRSQQRKNGPLVRILAFHDVADGEWFEAVIAMLTKNFNIITPQQFHTKEFDQKKINVLLTFDDGFQSWIDNCLPTLKSYSIKGLFFINSGLLDSAHDSIMVEEFMRNQLLISPKKPLTWDGAKLLQREGHTVGGHTRNHHNVATLSEEEMEQEVGADKNRIEEVLQTKLTDFAYPFGTKKHFSAQTLKKVEECGYTLQYSACTGFFHQGDGKLILRTLLEKNQSLRTLKLWILGGYDIFSSLK